MQRLWETLLQNIVFMIVLLPTVGACLVAVVSRFGIESIRRTALTNVLLTFSLSMLMAANYNPQPQPGSEQSNLIQMSTSMRWLAADTTTTTTGPDVRLAVGVDGISLWFVVLTAVLAIPAVLAGWSVDGNHPVLFYALLLLLESAMIGVFAAADVILFCVFLEFTLLALFLLIGGWGGHDRRRVVGKLFVFNLAGGLLVFLGLLAIVLAHSRMRTTANNPHPPLSFSTEQLIEGDDEIHGIRWLVTNRRAAKQYWQQINPWIFLALLIGFTIRVPLVPFHTWLPDANNEAPTSVAILLCGVGLKCGCYGYLRFLLPLFPDACAAVADVVTALAIAGMLYAALLALAQNDLKRLVTYACLSQIGLCVAGLFSMNSVGVAGGLLQLVNHGISAGAILYLIGLLEHRYQTRDMRAFGGLACLYPRLGLLFTLVTLSLIGVPGLNGFAGETLTLMGVFQGTRLGGVNAIGAACGLAGSLLIAWVFLRVLQTVFRGPLREPAVDVHDSAGHSATETSLLIPNRQRRHQATDLTNTEVAALLPAVVLIVWMGLFPQFFLSRIEPSVLRIVNAHKTIDETAQNSPKGRLKNRLKHGVAGVEAESSERSPQFFAVWGFPSVGPRSSFKTTCRRGVAGVEQREPPAFATSGGSAALRPQPPPSFETVSSHSDETAANPLKNGESDRSSRLGRTMSR